MTTRAEKREYLDTVCDEITLIQNCTTNWVWQVKDQTALDYYRGDSEDGLVRFEFFEEHFGNEKQIATLAKAMIKDLATFGSRKDFHVTVEDQSGRYGCGMTHIIIRGKRHTLNKIATTVIKEQSLPINSIDVIATTHSIASFGDYAGFLEECALTDTKSNRRDWNRYVKGQGWDDDVIPLDGNPISEGERKHAESQKKAEAAYKRKERIAKKNGWELDWVGNYIKPTTTIDRDKRP